MDKLPGVGNRRDRDVLGHVCLEGCRSAEKPQNFAR
jgi:hypothetical protein